MSFNERVINFSAGPSILPVEVMEQAARDMLNCNGSGMSVMEMSHRSKDYQNIIDTAEQDLRDLMNIPDNYKVLFLQGGESMQFAQIPLNLFRNSKKADFIVTGTWAKKAASEAKKFGTVNILASSEADIFTYIPKPDPATYSKDADYFYITLNNTIYGTHYNWLPETGDVPLVTDMSSCILSEEVDVTKFGLITAGAQKNIGPAGVTLAIIREDLIGHAGPNCPTMLDYKTQADNGSMYNTPPTFGIYIAGLTFKWLKNLGGLKAMEEINKRKAAKLYDAIDESKMFRCPVVKEDRSLMNVVFVTGDETLDKKFVADAKAEGLVNLGGHRSVGGMRASIYNAMPESGVDKLIDFMHRFEKENA
ncbi:MAG: 3-phosphoserine/phosphohydroxythreonine transaminase [Clostridiales bacterium]|nr:3-phosphoserine/phosphohydroxythreonine transaminase [Clostridiales bacterium]